MIFIFTLVLLASSSTLSLARPQVVAGSGSSVTGSISTISTISAICPPGTWSSTSSTNGYIYSTVLICSTTTGSLSNGIWSQTSATSFANGPDPSSYPTASQTSILGFPTSISTASSTVQLFSGTVSASIASDNTAPGNSASSTALATAPSVTSASGSMASSIPASSNLSLRNSASDTSASGSLASSSSASGSLTSSSPALGSSASSISSLSNSATRTSALRNSATSGTGTIRPISSSTVTGNTATSSLASAGSVSSALATGNTASGTQTTSNLGTSSPASSGLVAVSSALAISNTASGTQATSNLGTSSPTSSSLVASSASSLPPKSTSSSSKTPSTSTTPTNSLSAVQAQDSSLPAQCTNGAAPDASCFNALDLPDYILNWYKAADCGSLGFADCFYAKKTKYAPSKCDQLNGDAACTEPVWNDFKNNFNGPEDFYVAWNIWNTNGFFLDMYTAIGDADQSCANGLAAIIALLDPPTSQNVVLNDILDALTFGLALYAEGSILMKALLRSAPQTAGLLGKLFPSGTVDGQYQDWTVVSQKLGQVTDAFRASVADGLPLIQDNVTSFISWSQNSGLSAFRPPLNGLTDSMALSLNTYAISQIIQTQGIVVSRAPDTDVHALQTNGSKLNWDTGCSGGYTNGVCGTFFWDGTDTYGLTKPDDFTHSYHDELTSMFQNLTTGNLLFTGARQCGIASGKNGGGTAAIDTKDPTTFSCLSNLQVCTWDESGYGPFVDCPNLPADDAVLPSFGVSGCIGSTDDTSSIDVPRAYLGPGVYQDARNIPSLQADTFCDNIPY